MSSFTGTNHNWSGYAEPRLEGGTAVPFNFTSLNNLCSQLLETFNTWKSPYSAWQFESVFRRFSLGELERRLLLTSPFGKYVLVHDAMMKVVLIQWDQGETTSVHGHPAGGCLFKILHGNLVERRFDPVTRGLMSTHGYQSGAMAYIDDTIALHEVSNRSRHAAISLHAYTPGTISTLRERKERRSYLNNSKLMRRQG